MVECLQMGQETGIQFQVKLYKRLKKWYLIPPCLTLSIIRYVSRVKWSNSGKGVVPSPTLRCCSYWKGSFRSPSTTIANFTTYFILRLDVRRIYIHEQLVLLIFKCNKNCWIYYLSNCIYHSIWSFILFQPS